MFRSPWGAREAGVSKGAAGSGKGSPWDEGRGMPACGRGRYGDTLSIDRGFHRGGLARLSRDTAARLARTRSAHLPPPSLAAGGRGRFGVYREDGPDERAESNHPLLLIFDGEPVGTIRIDLPRLSAPGGTAILRMVAIAEAHQGRGRGWGRGGGHGRALLQHAEAFARGNGTLVEDPPPQWIEPP